MNTELQEEKPLSLKHQVFVDNLFIHKMDATKAYLATYPNASKETGSKKGNKLFQKVKKSEYFLIKQRKKEEKFDISFEKNLKDLEMIQKLAIEGDEVVTFKGEPTGVYKRDLSTAKACIAEKNKMLGYYAAEKKINMNVDVNEEMERIRRGLE